MCKARHPEPFVALRVNSAKDGAAFRSGADVMTSGDAIPRSARDDSLSHHRDRPTVRPSDRLFSFRHFTYRRFIFRLFTYRLFSYRLFPPAVLAAIRVSAVAQPASKG